MPLLATRLLNLQKEMKRKSLQLSCLKAKISQNCEASGVMVNEGLHSDLKAICGNLPDSAEIESKLFIFQHFLAAENAGCC